MIVVYLMLLVVRNNVAVFMAALSAAAYGIEGMAAKGLLPAVCAKRSRYISKSHQIDTDYSP